MYSVLVAALLVAGPAEDAASHDRQVYDVLKDLNNRGADLNNGGDPIGCYRVYEGGLIVLRSMLAGRAPLHKLIDDGLKRAEQRPLPERALVLHKTITELRAVLKPNVIQLPQPTLVPPPTGPQDKPKSPDPEPAKPATPLIAPPANPPTNSAASFPPPNLPSPAPILPGITLWEKLGGEKKIEKAVDEWLVTALADPKLDLTKGGIAKLEGDAIGACKRRLVGHLSNLTEGTIPYVGKNLADCHPGFALTNDGMTAFVGHLRKALANQGAASADIDAALKKIEEAR
ncbi:MAG: hypothetical protein K1X57_15995 [Gemmataceae bacterium]|nr:hypothetical protein [Gemmataceae bacterium]